MNSSNNCHRVRNKVAVVTGAARGIGAATAVALAREGSDIIGIDIAGPVSPILEVVPATPNDLEKTGRAVQEAERRWLGLKLDQRDIGGLRGAAQQIKNEFGGLDVIVFR